MPQFNTAFWVSQIFWLLVSFGGLYLGVSLIVFPLFKKIFTKRAQQIDVPLEKAEEILQEVQKLQQQAAQKKQLFSERQNQRLMRVHTQEVNRLQKTLAQEEESFSHHLKRQIQKLEREEKQVMANTSDFVKQALKGEQ